ncbi:MAG: efflux RND transporter permease subunit [Planctomycetota bacterium]|jgi:multidrug efflux pump subunit AcrB
MIEMTAGGPIAWMARNRVTPNLIMVLLIVGGLFATTQIQKEVFPSFDRDEIRISMGYRGASPEEIEQGILLPIEEAIQAVDGIEAIDATANEGSGTVRAELRSGADPARVQREIEQAVGRIATFPDDSEQPRVTQSSRRREVCNIQLYGPASEHALRALAERARDRLLEESGISQVDLEGTRGVEMHVEIPPDVLRSHGLTLGGVAAQIRDSSIELPGGAIRASSGDVLVRVRDRRQWAGELAQIPIVSSTRGGVVRLGELADIHDAFEEVVRSTTFNGQPSLGIEVYRVGDETPTGVSQAAKAAMADFEAALPAGVHWAMNRDRSRIYEQRLGLLLKNAGLGLVLVLVVLGVFLELRLAFWVTMGIPISFLGAIPILWWLGVSINIISLFAFIIALGIVVDDAVVAGENIYASRAHTPSHLDAAITGARGVASPISFSILTNMVTFLPLAFVPGFLGKIWLAIPMVVIVTFGISWFESLFILPAHLAHAGSRVATGPWARVQAAAAGGLAWVVQRWYRPFLHRTLGWRALTVAAGAAVAVALLGYVQSGRIPVIFMPRVESDRAAVTARLPVGSPQARAEAVRTRLVAAAQAVVAANGGDRLSEGILAQIDGNSVDLTLYLTQPDVRPISTKEVAEQWREATGSISGLESLRFESDRGGPGRGAAISLELSHHDIPTLERAAAALAGQLAEFPNVRDVDDGTARGKPQLDVRLRPAGESLGLTAADVGRQVRNAFYGAEAFRDQRKRDEMRVLVRHPAADRAGEHELEALLISTRGGRRVPLREVATVERGRAYTAIRRRDARRTLTVSANVVPLPETQKVLASVRSDVLPSLQADFPGLQYRFSGRLASRRDSASALWSGFLVALAGIYALLAIPFRSYTQPLVVMAAIPFGAIGAVFGHLIMDYELSMLSMMGIIALSGVVVNDALVLVDFANRKRAEGLKPLAAIREAGMRRFRPVLLTTLTTFFGLAPMILETSRQARFLIPMALSLAFGILFATLVTLVLVPSLYVLHADAVRGWNRLLGRPAE